MIHINKHITPFFEKMAIKKIKPSTILNFQDDTQTKLKPQTVNQVVNCLGRILSFCVLRELIETNPCREIKPLPELEVLTKRTPTLDEVRLVLKNCRKDWHEAIIRLCAETGCRISEALGLEWTHIRNDIIFIEQSAVKQEVGPTKTRSAKRKVIVSPEMALLLKTMRLRVPPSSYSLTLATDF